MSNTATVLAFDFGASSGRAIRAVYDGQNLTYEEIHRFENVPIEKDGHLCWDVETLLKEIHTAIQKAGTFDSLGFDTWGVDFGLLDADGHLLANPVHYRDARTNGKPEQAAACLEQVRSEPDAAPASANQTVLAEHYQAVIHTNDFYEYLKLYRELAHKQSTQRSKGRKVNAMDAYFYQMAERTLREELAVAFHETPEAAARRLEAAVS